MRYYEIDGKKLPSVTSLLPSPDLKQWAANCAVDYLYREYTDDLFLGFEARHWQRASNEYKRVSAIATKIGSSVHRYCERYLIKHATKYPY